MSSVTQGRPPPHCVSLSHPCKLHERDRKAAVKRLRRAGENGVSQAQKRVSQVQENMTTCDDSGKQQKILDQAFKSLAAAIEKSIQYNERARQIEQLGGFGPQGLGSLLWQMSRLASGRPDFALDDNECEVLVIQEDADRLHRIYQVETVVKNVELRKLPTWPANQHTHVVSLTTRRFFVFRLDAENLVLIEWDEVSKEEEEGDGRASLRVIDRYEAIRLVERSAALGAFHDAQQSWAESAIRTMEGQAKRGTEITSAIEEAKKKITMGDKEALGQLVDLEEQRLEHEGMINSWENRMRLSMLIALGIIERDEAPEVEDELQEAEDEPALRLSEHVVDLRSVGVDDDDENFDLDADVLDADITAAKEDDNV